MKSGEGVIFMLKCLLVSYVLTAGLLLLLALMLYRFGLKENIVNICIIAIYVIVTFLSGMMAGKRAGSGDGTADTGKAGDGIELGYFTSVTYGLYGYLLNVTEAALAEYLREEKKGKIREAREIIRTILDFKDTMGVYDCIENEIYGYKDILLPESMH